MSWQAHQAVLHNSKQEKLFRLMSYLAEYADDNLLLDPAPNQETIADFFETTTRTVRTWLNKLVEAGEIEQTRIGSGPGTPSAYRILLPVPAGKGGRKAEEIADLSSTFAEQMAEIKAEILELKAEVLALKAEKAEAKGGKGGSERRKAFSTESADDPYIDPSFDPEEESPPNPPRGEARDDFYGGLLPRWDDLSKLAQVFTAVSGIQPPHAGARYSAAKIRDRWLAPLAEIEDMANGSTEQLIRRAVDHMRQSGLTIADPHSIVNVSRSIHHNKNGPAGKKSDADQFDFSTMTDKGW